MSFLVMKCNASAKNNFETMSLIDFWVKYVHIHKSVDTVAIRTLLPFSSTYLRGRGFSTLLTKKTKHRNKLDCAADQSCVICYKSNFWLSKKLLHPSHKQKFIVILFNAVRFFTVIW